MSILIDKKTKLIVQGITGREGEFHARQMMDYGTHVVGGMTPGRGGEKALGVPVFDTMAHAVKATGANASVIYVPARGAADAILEAVDAGIGLVVCITEGVPVVDMLRVALERSVTPREAVQVIIDLLEKFGQGGNCTYGEELYYHNSFIIANAEDAWVL